jgi:hypothetical protein
LPSWAFSVKLDQVVVLMPNPLDAVFSRYGVTMSIEECAELLGIEAQQVRRRLRLPDTDPRHIPGYRPGGVGKWIVPTAAMRAYVEAGAGYRAGDDSPGAGEPAEK